MTFKLPNVDQIRAVGADIGMDITNSYAKSVIDYIAPFAEGYRTIVGLPDDVPPVKYHAHPAIGLKAMRTNTAPGLSRSASKARRPASSPARRSQSRTRMHSQAFR